MNNKNTIQIDQTETTSLDEAKSWIGRRLTLKKPLLEFKPGLNCSVMCVVDFGDGLLLWITSEEHPNCDVDQLSINDVYNFFEPICTEGYDTTSPYRTYNTNQQVA